MRVTLFRSRCIACGYCLSIATDLLIISQSDGKITRTDTPKFDDEIQQFEIDIAFRQEIEQSSKICPVDVIKILGLKT